MSQRLPCLGSAPCSSWAAHFLRHLLFDSQGYRDRFVNGFCVQPLLPFIYLTPQPYEGKTCLTKTSGNINKQAPAPTHVFLQKKCSIHISLYYIYIYMPLCFGRKFEVLGPTSAVSIIDCLIGNCCLGTKGGGEK
jgi:hypothetical protein